MWAHTRLERGGLDHCATREVTIEHYQLLEVSLPAADVAARFKARDYSESVVYLVNDHFISLQSAGRKDGQDQSEFTSWA